MRFTWKLFRSIIFILCVTCFSYQSANFFELYFKYPTVTNIDLIFPEVLKNPAFTLCNSNPVKRKKFCAEYPYLCQKPNNLTEFCKKHSYFCKGNISNLVIPKLGYYANDSEDEVRRALLQIYLHNISHDGSDLWSWTEPFNTWNEERKIKVKTTFTFYAGRSDYITCYSANLHINSSDEIETTQSCKYNYILPCESFSLDGTSGTSFLKLFLPSVEEEDTMYPWTVPRILFAIHSPFVPVSPFYEGEFLHSGHMYLINIQM
ncbi:uncharacterized protein NPIL_291251, partial [Nephila pilipes]